MNRVCRATGLLFLLFSMGTFVKAEDPLPMPGEEIQAGNKIEWDAKSPNSPKGGKVFASGTVTPAKDWTCKTVNLIVQDTANGKTIAEKDVATAANNTWAHTFENLPGGAVVRVKATGLFTKGNTKENKSVEGVLTVRP